ncbi:hypothetical protein BH10CHL1_BH10CHL1_15890 [soil metagenome]
MLNRVLAASRYKMYRTLLGCLALMLAILFLPIAAHAQSIQPDPTVCYAIADNQGNLPSGVKADNQDELVQINRTTAATTAIGATGTTDIESMTFVLHSGVNTLYAANGGTIGTVNLATGVFTAIGPAGSGVGSVGTVKFNDLDGLAYDPSEDVIYASLRVDNSNDLLLKLNVATGAHIPNAFGAGKDYLVVPAPVAEPTWQNVDDLSFDPTTGKLYATLNDSGTGGILVVLNKTTAALTEMGTYNDLATPGNFVDDIEGISFFNDGNLFATTGNNGPDKKDINKLWWINKQTGAASLIGPFPTSFVDYEALGCLTQSASLILKKFTNGEDADTPTGPIVPVGSAIVWTYVVTNTGAVALTNLTLTDDILGPITCNEGAIPDLSPNQSFSCSVNGTATTVGQYANIGTVNGTWNNPNGSFVITDTDPSHYFGAQAAIALQKTVYAGHNAGAACPGSELVTGKIGDAITYCFVVTNTGNTYLNSVVLDDLTLGINRTNLTLLSGTEPLAPNASLTFYYETTLSKGLLNTATTIGTPSDGGGLPIPGLPNVTAQDTAQVAVVGSIGDTVFIDGNNNNAFDAGEGVSGITVVLTLPGNTTQTTVTTGDGFYLFDNLPAGAYVVTVQTSGTPLVGLVNHVDPDGGNNSTSSLTLGAGENNLLQDFGYQQPIAQAGSLGDFVWQDTNGNGIQEAGEPGIPNVTVILTNGNGVTNTTVTNANGIYGFVNLPAGNYTVSIDPTTLPAGLQQTFDLDGINTPNSAVAPLAAGENRTDVDFGYQPGQQPLLGSLGDTVWQDTNGNSVQDATEAGIPNVTVILSDGQGGIKTTVTDANGIYGFTNLPAGAYTVSVDPTTLPVGLQPTFDLDGINTPHTTGATLTTGQIRTDVDFGYQPEAQGPGSLGDFVWQDTNGNGLQEAGEPGLVNVVVTLFDGSGNVLQTTKTDTTGHYLFGNLSAGSYVVGFTLPGGYLFSPPNQGNDPALDSDAGQNGRSSVVQLAQGENNLTIDAGIFGPPNLSILKSDNRNGVQVAPGESLIYTFVYSNTGLSDATGVILTEVVPQLTTFEAAKSSVGWKCANDSIAAGTICTFDVGTVAAKSTVNSPIKFAVKVDSALPNTAKQIANLVTITDDGTHGTPTTGNNTSTVTTGLTNPTSLDPSPEPGVTKNPIFLPLIQNTSSR